MVRLSPHLCLSAAAALILLFVFLESNQGGVKSRMQKLVRSLLAMCGEARPEKMILVTFENGSNKNSMQTPDFMINFGTLTEEIIKGAENRIDPTSENAFHVLRWTLLQ